MRFFSGLLLLITLLSFFHCTSKVSEQSKVTYVVKDGKAVNIIRAGKTWAEKSGFLECGGRYNTLFADREPKTDLFKVKAKLALARVDSTTAIFTFFNNHFGFDSSSSRKGERKRLFLYCQDRDTLLRFGKSEDYISPGVPFEFMMESLTEELIFRINGEEVARVSKKMFRQPFQGGVGLRPWLNTMRIYNFVLEGEWVGFPQVDYVFEKDELGYHCFRNPALVKTTQNTILAFSQGRFDDCYDLGDRDILVKRSTDGGTTWGPAIMVFDDDKNTCTGPTPIVDRETGRICILMTRIKINYEVNNDLGTAENGRDVFISYSSDDGFSWTQPENISAGTIKEAWRTVATGPGSGIQLNSKAYKDRMVAPCYFKLNEDKQLYAYTLYSDDRGDSWHIGNPTQAGVTECQVAELQDGRLYLTMRQQNESIKKRQMAISIDGGVNWQGQQEVPELIDDGCQASLAYYHSNNRSALLFANPASTALREKMTIRASFDDGTSWKAAYQLHSGPSAYSDLLVLDKEFVACFYEHGFVWPYQGLMLEKIPISVFY